MTTDHTHGALPCPTTSPPRPAPPPPEAAAPRNADAARARIARIYRLRRALPVYRRRVAAARQIVADALTQCQRPYIAFSGGKDSMAMLHLARTVAPDLDCVYFDCGCETPGTRAAIAAMRARGHDVTTLQTEHSIVEMCQMVGALGYDGPNKLDGQWHWKHSDWREVLVEEPIRRMMGMGYDAALVGLRREENRYRSIILNKYGSIHRRQDGLLKVYPLARWEGADVLAYLFEHELPLSDIYLDPDDTEDERQRRRTGTPLELTDAENGKFGVIKRRYPQFWLELTREFPHLRFYA